MAAQEPMAITPTGYQSTAATSSPSALTLVPGASGTFVKVVNMGGADAAVRLSTTSADALTVGINTGSVIQAGKSEMFVLGSNTILGIVGLGGNATLNLTFGS